MASSMRSVCSLLTRRRTSTLLRQLTMELSRRSLTTCSPLLSQHSPPSRGPSYTTELTQATVPSTPESPIPVYRVMDWSGEIIDPQNDPQLSDDVLIRMYTKMITLDEMDTQLYKVQRMGLISFYMMSSGETATHFGTAAALDDNDMVYAQYREAGVLMWRGFTVDDCMNQCFSNRLEAGKGRQMPVHYGSKEYSYQFISSCLSTQMPHAPGYAYGLKRAGSKNCVITYFGDGAAQEGDAHAAMNFAATLQCPVIFFCRNNGYAISTPASENCAGDGIASRGQGYGMETIRVDGNDVLAVYNVTKYAREIVVNEQRPILIEGMTYRLASHSTSDDQTGYQDMDEVKRWKEGYNPINRLRGYIEKRGIWDQSKDVDLVETAKNDVKKALQKARAEPKPRVDELFEDVFDKLPPRLEKQRREMWEVVNKYKEHYPLKSHQS